MSTERVQPAITDTVMLDWLEKMANRRGGILLHDGSEGGRMGLGLRPGIAKRSLREVIATAMRASRRHTSQRARIVRHGSKPVACRVCGCTDLQACPGGCHWVEPDLCSVCAEAELPF